jgi:hypothetical protein
MVSEYIEVDLVKHTFSQISIHIKSQPKVEDGDSVNLSHVIYRCGLVGD